MTTLLHTRVMNKFKIVEIFSSIEGEGKRAGALASFIRTAGCNIRCSYCDTAYALFHEKTPCVYSEMTSDEIIKRLDTRVKNVTLTGGEPLVQQHILELIERICSSGFMLNIETNGTVDVNPFRLSDNVFFTIDYKLPSSLMEKHMNLDKFFHLKSNDVIKFVIGTDEDCNRTVNVASEILKHYSTDNYPQLFLSAVNGKISNSALVELMKSNDVLSNARLQLQMHKIVWPDIDKGV